MTLVVTLTKTLRLLPRGEVITLLSQESPRKSCTNGDPPGGFLPVVLIAIKACVSQDPGGTHRSFPCCHWSCPESLALSPWKPQSVLTLDALIPRLEGLAGWQPVAQEVTCQQEPLLLLPLPFRATLQPTGREIIESDLLEYNSRLIL